MTLAAMMCKLRPLYAISVHVAYTCTLIAYTWSLIAYTWTLIAYTCTLIAYSGRSLHIMAASFAAK